MSERTITLIHQGCDFSDALLWRCGRTCAWAFVDPGVGGSTEGNLRLKVGETRRLCLGRLSHHGKFASTTERNMRRDEKSLRFSQRT